jgi:hypothetical protein
VITNVDAEFLALPLDNCSDAAITAAKAAGALHVMFELSELEVATYPFEMPSLRLKQMRQTLELVFE